MEERPPDGDVFDDAGDVAVSGRRIPFLISSSRCSRTDIFLSRVLETVSSLSDLRRTRHFHGLKRRVSEANLDLRSAGRLFQLLIGVDSVAPPSILLVIPFMCP